MSKRNRLVVLISLIGVLLLAGAGGVVLADDHNSAVPEGQVIEGEEGIDVWERAVLPLRVDYDDAAVSVPNAAFDVDPPDEGPVPLNYDTVGVFNANATVSAEFEERTGADALPNEELTFVLVKVNGSFTNAQDVFEDPSIATLNELGEYETVGTETTNRRGSADVSFTPNESGQYVLLAATDDGQGGLTVTDGELGVEGNATIVGFDFVVVQSGNAEVRDATARVSAGDNATFEVESGFEQPETDEETPETDEETPETDEETPETDEETESASDEEESTQHVLILYDERTYVNQRFVLSVEEGFAGVGNISENATLQSTIAEVNGTFYTRGEPQVGALALKNDTGSLAFEGFVASIQGAVEQGQFPEAEAIDDTTLYASASVVDGEANTTFPVGTNESWRPGPYQYVYVASQGDEIRTATGQLIVLPSQAQGGSDRPGRGAGQGAPTVRSDIVQSGHVPVPQPR